MIPTDILNYKVLRLLGSGGMGSVYLAANTNIDQLVAIKALRPEVARNPMLRARFKQEAELLCSLDHPGIVKFLNYVEMPQGIFLIMEYVKGVTLEDFIKKKNGLIVEEKAYPLICEILDAFSYAHSKGIVHRDIKPSNIIIQEDGHIKVMDFGIAQIVSEANESQQNWVMGTPTYMSPEQVYGKNVDVRSDIYSLGVLIHNMLTGRAPYDATTMTEQEIKRSIVNSALVRMADYYPYVSDKIQQVVDKATQKVPEARYQTCKEMKHAVKKAIAPDPIPRPVLYSGIVAAAILLIGAFFTWDYFRTKVEYYKDYVEVYGVPKGVGSLSGREMSHREASYRFEYSRHKLRRVSFVNSKGKLVDHHDSEGIDKIVDMTLTYTEGSEKVDAAKYMNRSGKVLYVKDYDSNFKTCTFKLDDELGTEMTLNSQVQMFESMFDNDVEGKSKISKYILDHDDQGRLTKVEYAGYGNIRVPDGQGIFGRKYVYDEDGRLVEEHYLGKDGKPKATQCGLGVKIFTYDDDDNVVKIEYRTPSGKPSSDGNNCPVLQNTFDKWGNKISEKYFDTNGKPMLRKDAPFAGIMTEYDDDGFPIKRMYLGLDGNITYVNGVSGSVNEYDENGYLAKVSMIDAAGRAAFYSDNETGEFYSKYQLKNDEKGNPIEFKLLNANDELMENASWAHKTCTYDSVGNQLTEYYYDKSGKVAAPASLGFAGITVSYNPQGRVEVVTFMDAQKRPTNRADTHFCYMKNEYDARGNYTRKAFYDTNHKLVLTDEGIASVCFEYDDNGNETTIYFLNTEGKPCVRNYSFARCEFTYDDQGNIATERYKNEDGNLMLVDGKAGVNCSYDARGNVTIYRPIGLGGSLAPDMQEVRYVYDDRDNIIEEAYFGASGNKVNGNDGFHKVTRKYNAANQNIQEEYYNTAGLLTNVKGQNFAVVKREYDQRANVTSVTYFTQTGDRGSDQSKVHKYYYQYDDVVNKKCHQITFGTDGKPVVADGIAKEGRVEYDARGNMVKLICYDGYGKKCNGEHGWCEMRYTYDDSGLVTSWAYFTIDNKPHIDPESKYHKLVYGYNAMRLIETETYYGTNNKPINCEGGFSTIKAKYNKQNQCEEKSYFGTNGQKVNNKGGYHREHYYFKAGAQYKCDYFDVSGRKIGTAIKVNNKWEVQGVGAVQANAQAAQYAQPDWRSQIDVYAAECPANVGNGVIVESISAFGNTVYVHIKLENEETTEVGEALIAAISQVKAEFRQSTGIPSYVEVYFTISNKYNEKLITL